MRETQSLLEAATDTITATPTQQPIPSSRALVPVEPPGKPVDDKKASGQTDVVAVGVAGFAGYHIAREAGFDPWLGALLGALWGSRK